MHYLLLLPIALVIFPTLQRRWNQFLTGNMIRQYDTLVYQILSGMDFAEANQEITDFKYVWLDHPECDQYVALLRRALKKVEFEEGLGI